MSSAESNNLEAELSKEKQNFQQLWDLEHRRFLEFQQRQARADEFDREFWKMEMANLLLLRIGITTACGFGIGFVSGAIKGREEGRQKAIDLAMESETKPKAADIRTLINTHMSQRVNQEVAKFTGRFLSIGVLYHSTQYNLSLNQGYLAPWHGTVAGGLTGMLVNGLLGFQEFKNCSPLQNMARRSIWGLAGGGFLGTILAVFEIGLNSIPFVRDSNVSRRAQEYGDSPTAEELHQQIMENIPSYTERALYVIETQVEQGQSLDDSHKSEIPKPIEQSKL